MVVREAHSASTVWAFCYCSAGTGDDRRRTHDMNTANWVPDLFMKRLMQGKNWTLFSPDETPDLHDAFGLEFEEKYQTYEAKAARGEIKNFKTNPEKI